MSVVTGSVLLALLAGCGEQTDLTKVTYPRTALPPVTDQASAGDSERLTAEGLRLIDPCGLLDPTVLAKYGEPEDNVAQDFDGCRNYMRDANGESLSMSVRVGETLTDGDLEKSTEQIGGFKARVSTVEGACFVTLVVEQADPVVGVTLQTGYKAADPCPPAREVAADLAQRLSTTGAVREPRPGSLLPLDPCTLPGALPAEAVPGAAEPDPFGLHQCSWRSRGGAELELEFAYRIDPGESGAPEPRVPVSLGGGVTAHQVLTEQTFAKCQLGWTHLADTGGLGDVVEIEVRDIGDTGLDVCAAAVTFAKDLLPKLPKA